MFGGQDYYVACLEINKTGFYQKENMLVFVCNEAIHSKLVKLETVGTVSLPAIVSILWLGCQ